jgi:hypothetical protein
VKEETESKKNSSTRSDIANKISCKKIPQTETDSECTVSTV